MSSWVKNVFLLLCSFAVSVVFFELALIFYKNLQEANVPRSLHTSRSLTNLELHDYQNHYCSPPFSRNRLHSTVKSRERPLSAFFQFENDQVNFYVHNELGFRGTARPIAGKSGVFVVGDSFTRGVLADETETIPAFLNRWISDYQFLNFGTGGHGTLQHLETYKEFANKIPHEAIMVLIYTPNDLQDNIGFKRFLLKENSAQKAYWKSLKSKIRPQIESLGETQTGQLIAKSYWTLRRQFSPSPSSPTEKELVLLRQSLTDLKLEAGARPFHLVTIPGREEFDHQDRWQRNNPVVYANLVRREVDKLGMALDINVLHLKESISKRIHEYGVDAVYGWPNYHFTEQGYYFAAREIATWLSAKTPGFKAEIEDKFVNRTQFNPARLACP
ncbi:hypothetical protein [Anderseniella sp. Alg231-50]|uniref:hypothetical protein n=1 Tax=Anderseniella sp. Alg231-50 TaxID=1922226 RepID=UPI00307C9E63